MGQETPKEDTFLTIAGPSEGLYKEKGSKFLAFAYPVTSLEEVKKCVEKLKKNFYDARHHCYAYALGKNRETLRANDDGEPSSSAGKPILGQLYAFDVSDVLIVVVRYFGGKKLGVGGLIQAYKSAAAAALGNAKIITCTLTRHIIVYCSFSEVDLVMRVAKNYKLGLSEHVYTAQDVCIELEVRESLLEEIKAQLDFAKKLIVRT